MCSAELEVDGNKVLFGADPELFVRCIAESASRVLNPGVRESKINISAHRLIPGTKYDPYIVPNGAIQVDGTALEFNINPSSSYEEFDTNINEVLKTLLNMLPQNHEFDSRSTIYYEPYVYKYFSEEETTLGCEPDYNAYTGEVNSKPVLPDPGMRTAAGHIHIGWGEDFDPEDDEHFSRCCRIVQQLDAGVGLASILIDNDTKRRQLYGAAGAFRPKPYGVEYRVLSNFWVFNKAYRKFVWNRVKESCKYMMVEKEFIPSKFPHIDFQKAINEGDKKVAETFESYKLFHDIPFPPVK